MSFAYRRHVLGEHRFLSKRFDARPVYPEVSSVAQSLNIVSLQEIKNFSRVRHDLDDGEIFTLLKQSVSDVEQATGRAIVTQTVTAWWKLVWDYVWLPRPPHISVTSITEIDGDQAETTITDFKRFGLNEWKLEFNSSIGNQLKVVYEAGFGSEIGDIPAWARAAVLSQFELYYTKSPDIAIDKATGLTMQASNAVTDHIYILPE